MSEVTADNRKEVLEALEKGEFIPYFQPQYNYLQKNVSGAEVLARWQKPDGTVGAPFEFIPVLEEDDSIIELDFSIMEKTCVLVSGWIAEGRTLPPLSLNLSRRTSLSDSLVERTEGIIAKYGLKPDMFRLEITESAYIENYDLMYGRVNELKEHGFILEMDDFGTGYSSLGFLRDAPMDILKMDMSFLRMDKNRGKGGSIISSIVRMAGDLQMDVIAEGVETLEQAEFLKSIGCFFMQGFYFARPMDSSHFLAEMEKCDVYIAPADSFHEVNRALDFLDDTTQSALLFNSFVGGAVILEYRNQDCFLVRANDRFFEELGMGRETSGVLNTGLLQFFDNNSQLALIGMLEKTIETETEGQCQVRLNPIREKGEMWLQVRARCLAEKPGNAYIFYVVITNVTEEKRLAAKNVEISRELSSVINNVPGGFARFAFDGDRTECEFMSEGFIRLHGHARSELEEGYAKDIASFVHPDDADMVKRTIQSMKGDKRGRRILFRLVAADGSQRWVGSQNSMVQYASGYSLFVYCWDETDRILLRDKLQLQNNELQTMKETLEGGSALYEFMPDGSLELLQISEEAASITGRSPEEYMEEYSRDPLFCTYAADKKRITESLEQLKDVPRDYDMMYRVVAKNGKILWVRFKATINVVDNRRRLLFGVFSNLSATRELYQTLVNDADTAIVVTDLSTHEILYANEKAAEMGDTTKEQAIGKTCYKCLHKCDRIGEKCELGIPEEESTFDEVRDGRIYRVKRKRIDWNGIEAGICYITDRTDTVFRDNTIVDKAAVDRVAKEIGSTVSEEGVMEAGIAAAKWENILKVLTKRKTKYENLLTDEKMRIRIQFSAVYLVLGVVSLGMTVMNIFTDWKILGIMTLVFGLINFANLALCMISERTELLSRGFYAVEMIALFTGFAIVGEPEGFSILWSVLLPTLGLFLYKVKLGSILSGIQWLILVLLFWTGAGRSLLQYEYTDSFLERFPVLYLSLFCLGFLFEFVRSVTQRELNEIRHEFEHLYNHDALTGLYNRYGFNSTIENISEYNSTGKMAFAIMDLDNFKHVNDTYGHMQGDRVLRDTGKLLTEIIGDRGIVCRWGGEEFSCLFFDAAEATTLCESILESCRDRTFEMNGDTVRVTISIGLVKFEGFSLGGSSEVLARADDNLYASKTNGKDCLTETTL